MIVVEMNDDIRSKDTKFFGNYSFRQIICIVIGAAYAIPIAVFLPGDISLRIIVGIILAMPAIACGKINRDGQYAERLAIRFVYKQFLTPKVRKNMGTSYTKLRKKLENEKESERINKMPKNRQKAYLKAKKKGMQIRYSKKKENKIYR